MPTVGRPPHGAGGGRAGSAVTSGLCRHSSGGVWGSSGAATPSRGVTCPFLQEEVVASSVLLEGEISGEAKRNKEITRPLSDAAARERARTPARAGKGGIGPNHPRSLPGAGECVERLPANSSAVPQGTRRTSESGARSQPGAERAESVQGSHKKCCCGAAQGPGEY